MAAFRQASLLNFFGRSVNDAERDSRHCGPLCPGEPGSLPSSCQATNPQRSKSDQHITTPAATDKENTATCNTWQDSPQRPPFSASIGLQPESPKEAALSTAPAADVSAPAAVVADCAALQPRPRIRILSVDGRTVARGSSPARGVPQREDSAEPARRRPGPTRSAQSHLTFGQKAEALTCCPQCGVHYTRGVEADEQMHARLHFVHEHGVKLPAWQSLRIASASSQVCAAHERIVVVLPTDPAKHLAKVREVCELIETGMGWPPRWITQVPSKVLLYLREQLVVGLVAIQPLTRGQQITTVEARPEHSPARPEAPDGHGVDHRSVTSGDRAVDGTSSLRDEQPTTAATKAVVSEAARRRVGRQGEGAAAAGSGGVGVAAQLRAGHALDNSAHASRRRVCADAATSDVADESWLGPGAGRSNKCGRRLGGPVAADATACRRSEPDDPGERGIPHGHGHARSVPAQGPRTPRGGEPGCTPAPVERDGARSPRGGGGDSATPPPSASAWLQGRDAAASLRSGPGAAAPGWSGGASTAPPQGAPRHRRRARRLAAMLPHATTPADGAAQATGSASHDGPHTPKPLQGGPALGPVAAAQRHDAPLASRTALAPSLSRPAEGRSPGEARPLDCTAATSQAQRPRQQVGERRRAVCGVRALWVSRAYRRQGIATRLLDAARAECMRGYMPYRREVAFAQQCDEGVRFAARYCETNLVMLFAGD